MLRSVRDVVRHLRFLVVGVVVVGLLPPFAGCHTMSKSDLDALKARLLASPQWKNGRFDNPPEWPRRLGLGAVLKWQLTPGRPGAPNDFHPPFVENDGKALRENHGGTSVTWIGHATALIQGGGMSLLTDPIFSNRISGIMRRYAPPGVLGPLLPPIDVVVISHNHRDHLDEDSVMALGPTVTYVVPLGLGPWFKKRGLTRVVELDWWETTEIVGARGGRLVVTLVPAQHWSRRGAFDENKSLWGGYVIAAGGKHFYFAGDTGYPAAFKEIGKRFPDLDYALIPIGAYEPRWFMCSQHISPEQAALVFREVGAKRIIPVHWGTFHLSDEPMDEPPRLLQKSMGADADRIMMMAIGESFFEPSTETPRDDDYETGEPVAQPTPEE